MASKGHNPTLTVYALWRTAGSVMALLRTSQGALPVILCSEAKFDLGKLDSLRRGWQDVNGVAMRVWHKGKRLSMLQCPTQAEIIDETFRINGALPSVPSVVKKSLAGLQIKVIVPATATQKKQQRHDAAVTNVVKAKDKKCVSDLVKKTLRRSGLDDAEIERVICAARLVVTGMAPKEVALLIDALNRPKSRGDESDIGFVLAELLSEKL